MGSLLSENSDLDTVKLSCFAGTSVECFKNFKDPYIVEKTTTKQIMDKHFKQCIISHTLPENIYTSQPPGEVSHSINIKK